MLLLATALTSASCTVRLKRSFQHSKTTYCHYTARLVPYDRYVCRFPSFKMHATFKTGIPWSQLPVCSVVFPPSLPAIPLNSFFHASSYFLMLYCLSSPIPFPHKTACSSIIQGFQRKSGVLAFRWNQEFLTRKIANLSDLLILLIMSPASHLSVWQSAFGHSQLSINTEKNVPSHIRFLQKRLALARLWFTLRLTSIKPSSKIKRCIEQLQLLICSTAPSGKSSGLYQENRHW